MLLHHLIYESQVTHPFTEAELADLLRKARITNEEKGLTGLLLYAQDGRFVQVLEGDVNEVHELYFMRISRDPRHQHLTLLADGRLDHRRFAHWRMGYRLATPEALTELTGHVSTADATFLLPVLPNLPSPLLDKLLDYVQYTASHPLLKR
ncbi:BLUF domain-containing protein [Hymenobacter bucti]|uniref:BLUF domain-containing protein n=1 Tax=Hymenobacter bucti TaxID=1844114 RepID=A0ABW4QT72_9BACT